MIVSPPRRTFRQTRTAAILSAIVASSVAAFAFTAGFDDVIRRLTIVVIVLAIALIVALQLLGRRVLTIHDEGVRVAWPFGMTELEWRQIHDYRYRVVPTPGAPNLYLTLFGDNGEKVAVTSAYQGADEAISVILAALQEPAR